MKALQLDIFSGAAIAAITDNKREYSEWLSDTHVIDPCLYCEFRELCPPDDCGAKGFPIDVPTEDYMSESEYMEIFHRMG